MEYRIPGTSLLLHAKNHYETFIITPSKNKAAPSRFSCINASINETNITNSKEVIREKYELSLF
ncbi:MAG: hypothetical protein HYX39_06595 [Bacteroidetes bacterium]|nr:hypothetical protein [Bacteroidota bacterium]